MKKSMIFVLMAFLFLVMTHPVGATENKQVETKIRLVHASPNAPAVDIFVDGQKVLSNVKFKDASDYMSIAPGKHKVEIVVSGVTKDKKPVLTKEVDIVEGKWYTGVAINKAENLDVALLESGPCKADGKACIRVGHFSPDAPAVDVAVKDGAVVFGNTAYKTVTPYASVNPATYNLEVRAAGTKNVVLDLSNTELKANTAYTVLAVGCLNEEPKLSVIVLQDICQ